MISSHMTHDQLVATLEIEFPLGRKFVSSDEPIRTEAEKVCTNIIQSFALCTTPAVYLTTSFDSSTPLLFRRLLDLSPVYDQEQPRDGTIPAYSLQYTTTGATSIVYRSNGLIIKVSLPKCQAYLENEVSVYQHLINKQASKYIPLFYGYFGYRSIRAIILSDDGPGSLHYLEDLSNELKKALFSALVEIHEANVILGELELCNVLIGERGPIISEFGHASLNYICPGVSKCPELSNFQEMLDIDGNEWIEERHRTPMSKPMSM